MSANLEHFKQYLRDKEGERNDAYLDSEGNPTVGVGHLLRDYEDDEVLDILGLDDELENWLELSITDEQMEKLLDYDVEKHLNRLSLSFTDAELDALEPARYIAVASMAFQLGSLVEFPSMVKAVKEGDWNRAADEMLWSNGLRKQRRSAWYKQTPNRCQDAADKMRNDDSEKPSETEPSALSRVPTEQLVKTIEQVTAELQRRIDNNIL